MQSIPLGLIQIGLNAKDYESIAKNVQRTLAISSDGRKDILERLVSEIPEDVLKIATDIYRGMFYDKKFYSVAGLNYNEDTPGEGCFKVAFADYLLRNKDRLQINKEL
ncbi:MAG: hypothetical protein IH845_02745 [Nanoarchaeota archaeon]|nr:hypothetical protein [Nanoarchaeota archaeon]